MNEIAKVEADDLTSEQEFERVMEATQLLIGLKGGDVLTDEQAQDLRFLDDWNRREDERATEAFNRGYQYGLERGGGADTAKLIEERDDARTKVTITNALSSAREHHAFIRGAQVCREMMARFVHVGEATAAIAQSIRLNWRPSWGQDPGAPTDEQFEQAAPCVITCKGHEDREPDMWWDKDDPETPYDGPKDWADQRASMSVGDTPQIVNFMTGYRGPDRIALIVAQGREDTDDVDYQVTFHESVDAAKAARQALEE